MLFTTSDFDDDADWTPNDFLMDEEKSPKLKEAESALQELGSVLDRRRKEQGGTIAVSDRGALDRLRISTVGRKLLGDTAEERAARVAGGNVGLLEIPQTMLKFTTAPPQLTEPIREATEPLISRLSPEAAGVTRAIRDVGMAAVGSLPAGALMPARLVAAPFAADYASTLPEQFQAIREAEDTETALQALTTTGLGGALTAAGTVQALKPGRRIAAEPERIPDASPIIETVPLDGPVREVAKEVAQEVPAQISGEGVPSPKGQTVQSEVLLTQEAAPALVEPPAQPILVGANRRGNSIRLEFDTAHGPITAEQITQMLSGPDRSVEVIAFEPNEFSTAQGRANFSAIIGTPEGPYSTELAKKTYQEAFGTSEDIKGKSTIEKVFPFEERFSQSLRRSTERESGVTTKPPTPVSIDPTPSGQALGIVPPGSGKLMDIIDQAIGKPKEVGPPIRTETDTPLPDFQEHGVSKKIFSQPFGFENLPVIGALFGGIRRLKGHVNESLSTYWAERQIGRSVASAFGSEYSWLDKPFEIKDGQITNITPAKEGASRYISDVFETLQKDPTSYKLNAEQQKAFDAMQKLEKDFSRLEERYKVGKGADSEAANTNELLIDADLVTSKGPYFPRIVTERPGGVETGLTRGSSVGSKAFFEKPRLFDTEAEGWAKGYKYESSIVNRLATRTERLYKRIADKRIANDKSLEGVGRAEVESQLKASFAEELASGEMTEKKISQMADSIEARGRVYAPAFFNKIFPESTANQLNKAFPQSQSSLRQAAASINNALKGLQLGLDLGVGFIQGQALLARHPGIWAKAQFNSLAALFHREQFPNYVRNNLEPVRELAQLGSGVGRLEEYMAGLGGKELLSRVPGVKAFGRQFQTFLDVAKVEMWKAFRETTPKEQWSDVAQTLESVLSSGRMEGVGISQNRALSERALLLAPSYYRGGLNMIAAMAEKGVSGQIARRAMTAYATAGAVLFYGLGKMLGMSDDDLKERMNPARSDFMLWRFKTKDRISNVGFGGFYRSLLRLMGNTAKTSMENPENWASLAPNKNPITKWYRGHAGPVVQQVWDQFSGKDYLGQDADLSTTRRAITPLALEALRKKPGQPSPTAAEVAQTFVGLQGYPSTSKSELNKLHKDWLSGNKDPKVKADFERSQKLSFPSSKYSDLNSALIDKDQKATAQAIKDLQVEGVKRSDIFRRMNPYTADGSAMKPIFHESAVLESKFKKSLSVEQLKLYEQARADRKEQWKLFLKAYRESK